MLEGATAGPGPATASTAVKRAVLTVVAAVSAAMVLGLSLPITALFFDRFLPDECLFSLTGNFLECYLDSVVVRIPYPLKDFLLFFGPLFSFPLFMALPIPAMFVATLALKRLGRNLRPYSIGAGAVLYALFVISISNTYTPLFNVAQLDVPGESRRVEFGEHSALFPPGVVVGDIKKEDWPEPATTWFLVNESNREPLAGIRAPFRKDFDELTVLLDTKSMRLDGVGEVTRSVFYYAESPETHFIRYRLWGPNIDISMQADREPLFLRTILTAR